MQIAVTAERVPQIRNCPETPAHLSVQHQFGSTGTVESGDDQVDIGGDYAGFSLDAVYSHVDAAISAASLSAAQAAVEPVDTLAATVSDNTTYSFQGKYVYGPAKIYGAYEHIKYENPSHPLAAGVTDIGGYLLSVVSDTAYTHHRVLEISWVGLRYSVLTDLDLVGAYYRYDQNSYKGNGCSNSSASSCSGSENFFSFSADYRFTKRLDVYAGAMYSHVLGGLANGYLKTEAIDPMAGVRFNF